MTAPWGGSPEYLTGLAKFVLAYHPQGVLWTDDPQMLDMCWISEVYDTETGDTVGLVWYGLIKTWLLEMHGCAHPDWRARWLSPRIIEQIWEAVVDAAQCPDVTCVRGLASTPQLRRLYSILGWDKDEDDYYYIDLERDNEQEAPEGETAQDFPH
jgi:hypothetical protein